MLASKEMLVSPLIIVQNKAQIVVYALALTKQTKIQT